MADGQKQEEKKWKEDWVTTVQEDPWLELEGAQSIYRKGVEGQMYHKSYWGETEKRESQRKYKVYKKYKESSFIPTHVEWDLLMFGGKVYPDPPLKQEAELNVDVQDGFVKE